MRPISAVIITRNEEENLARCLGSLGWVDEIVVVDAHSGDGTVAVAAAYTDRIYLHEFSDFAAQKNFALAQASHEWVLVVDADEVVPEALAREIGELAARGPGAYAIPRDNYIFGRRLRYGGNQHDAPLRLFRRDRASFHSPVHETLTVNGEIGRLSAHLLHYSTPDLDHYRRKLRLYTELETRAMRRRNVRTGWLRVVTRPVGKFVSVYFLKAGFRDGLTGLVYYGLSAWYTFRKEAKYLRLARRTGRKEAGPR